MANTSDDSENESQGVNGEAINKTGSGGKGSKRKEKMNASNYNLLDLLGNVINKQYFDEKQELMFSLLAKSN